METALVNDAISGASDAAPTRYGHPMAVAVGITVASIALVWVATAVMLRILTDASTWGAIGVGAYASFWLGGGFGVIFGSAAVFGKDH